MFVDIQPGPPIPVVAHGTSPPTFAPAISTTSTFGPAGPRGRDLHISARLAPSAVNLSSMAVYVESARGSGVFVQRTRSERPAGAGVGYHDVSFYIPPGCRYYFRRSDFLNESIEYYNYADR